MRRRALSVIALAAAGLSGPALAQDSAEEGSAGAEALASSYCDTAFFRADVDEDGLLSEEELGAGLGALFEEIDADGDGEISRDEFEACESRALEAVQAAYSEAYGDVGTSTLEEAWAAAAEGNPAIDGDGMSRADFIGAAADAFQRGATQALDAEGADPVEFTEPFIFLGESQRFIELTAEEFAASSAYTFELTDRDGDDRLTREEFIERGEELTVDIEKVNARFDAMDADGSESLTPEEFIGMDRLRADGEPDPADGIPVIYYFFYQRG